MVPGARHAAHLQCRGRIAVLVGGIEASRRHWLGSRRPLLMAALAAVTDGAGAWHAALFHARPMAQAEAKSAEISTSQAAARNIAVALNN